MHEASGHEHRRERRRRCAGPAVCCCDGCMPHVISDDAKTDSIMKDPRSIPVRRWLVAALIITLMASHGIILYYVSSHKIMSAAALSVVIILVVIKHLGLIGPGYALLRRRSRHSDPDDREK